MEVAPYPTPCESSPLNQSKSISESYHVPEEELKEDAAAKFLKQQSLVQVAGTP